MLIASCFQARAIEYPSFSTTLKNGLKVIVCEKTGNDFAFFQVTYRTGSKDEKEGIRGMAHMFEHMMFRGTEKYPGNAVFDNVRKVGGDCNASTSFDRTEYHEYVPASALEKMMDIEADRMNNLVITQDILNTERQVVGEELRNGLSNWYGKMNADRYKLLYPEGHPYEVDVIGFLDQITAFTTAQCQAFYDAHYAPNNAFVVVVGNVKHEEVFALAEKYFGVITKHLKPEEKKDIPDVFTSRVKLNDLALDFPLQIYSYVIPLPAATDKDYFAIDMLGDLLFFDDNSILKNRLINKDHQAYAIQNSSDKTALYPHLEVIDIIMNAQMGNVKVKKAIREEIDKIASDGIDQRIIDNFIKGLEATYIMDDYSAEGIAIELGNYEYYGHDYNLAYHAIDNYKKVTPEDLKRVAATYFSTDRVQVINVKPID